MAFPRFRRGRLLFLMLFFGVAALFCLLGLSSSGYGAAAALMFILIPVAIVLVVISQASLVRSLILTRKSLMGPLAKIILYVNCAYLVFFGGVAVYVVYRLLAQYCVVGFCLV